jgi:hypothetical protein
MGQNAPSAITAAAIKIPKSTALSCSSIPQLKGERLPERYPTWFHVDEARASNGRGVRRVCGHVAPTYPGVKGNVALNH